MYDCFKAILYFTGEAADEDDEVRIDHAMEQTNQ